MKSISHHITGNRSTFSRKTTWALTSIAALLLLSVLVQKTFFSPEQTVNSPSILKVQAEPKTEVSGSPRNPAFPAENFASSGKETGGVPAGPLPVKSSDESPLRRWQYGSHWGKESDPALAAFSGWAQLYLGADETERAGMATEGLNLAQQRREAMLDLIATDPREALASSVPFSVRRQLPSDITAQLEQRVSGKGSLLVMASVAHESDPNGRPGILRHALIGEERFTAHVFGDRKNQRTTTDISLHGVALDQQLALSDSPIRLLESGEQLNATAKAAEAICSVSGLTAGPTTGGAMLAASGDQTHWLCRGGHIEALEYKVRAQEGGGSNGGVVTPSYSSTGSKKILVIMVDFSDFVGGPVSQSTAQASINDVTAFIQSNAFNQITFTAKDVTPTLRMPRTGAYYVNPTTDGAFELMTDARNAAAAAGFTTSNYDFDVIAFANIGFPWGGLGYVGWKGSWVQGDFHRGVTAHELGHNFGNWHANSWVSSTIIGTNGTHNEYGNPFDVLGGAYNYPRNHHSANFKFLNGWLPNAYLHTITTNGTYRIYAQDFGGNLDPARKYGIRIPVGISAGGETEDYWIDFRQGYTGNTAAANGAMLKWGNDLGTQSGSRLLDTQPVTLGNMDDAPLLVGRTFTDPARSLSITTLAKGGSGADTYLDIQITFGATPPVTLGEALDLDTAAWSTGGDGSWTGQAADTHDGTDAAASEAINHNQQSFVETTVTGPGTLTFWWKVSSESGYDYLSFLSDGLVMDSISGEQVWQKRTNAVPAGAHTLCWRYSKDGSVVSGADRGWLDEVTFTPTNEAPTNDMFASHISLFGPALVANGSNVNATAESGEPLHAGITGGKSVWWSWTAASTAQVTITTAGSSYDTLLGVYTGSSVSGLTFVAGNDDSEGLLTSTVAFQAVAGMTYQIAVDGYHGASGGIQLAIAVTPPVNDLFANRATLPGTTASAAGYNEAATMETGEPLHAGITGGHSVWWSWTASVTAPVTVTTAGSSFDTLLGVYTGSSVSGLTAIGGNDDSDGTLQSRVAFMATAGMTYQFAVDGYHGATGNIQINVRPAPPLVMLPPERLADGTFRIRLGSTNGAPIDLARVPFIAVYATTNLALPLSAWTLLRGNITSSNGVAWIDDPEARNRPMRFYCAVERP